MTQPYCTPISKTEPTVPELSVLLNATPRIIWH
jgi:hypothetical protein